MTVSGSVLAGLSLVGRLDPVDRLARLAAIRDDQQRRWRGGDRLPAEDYLRAIPGLADDPSLALDVIYSEVLLRRQLGEAIAEADYLQRFPDRADSLRILFVGYRGLHDTGEPQTVAEQQTVSERYVAWENYELLEKLGEGGMGVVWKARHVPLNRLVALKMLRQDGFADPERFRGEAEAVGRLHHPNIVQLYDFGTHDGALYLTQEFVAGGSLAERLRQGPLAPRIAAVLVEALACGVQHAHDRHILHRDLKPANILLQEGLSQRRKDAKEEKEELCSSWSSFASFRLCESLLFVPKIADFGLAKRLDELQPLTRTGSVLGTPSYMSPEQASGDVKNIGPACDVYSLGAILYECLTGRPPFRAGCLFETLRQVRLENPIPPRELTPHVPAELEAICLKCLEKQPARRYASARLLALELRRFLDPRPPRWHGWGSLLAVLLLVGVVALTAAQSWRPEPSRPHDPERPGQTQSRELLPDYSKRLADVRTLTERRPLGWRQTVLDELAVFEQANPPQRRPQVERGLKLSALAGIDIEPPRFVLHDLAGTCLAYAPDGRLLAVALSGNAVRLFDANGRLVHSLSVPADGGAICCLSFARNSGSLAAATLSGKVYCWHLDDNVTAPQLSFALKAGPVVGLDFSHDSKHLFAASAGETGVYRWEVQSTARPTPTLSVEMDQPATGLAVWASDRVVWLGSGESRLLNQDTLKRGKPETLRALDLHGPLVSAQGNLTNTDPGVCAAVVGGSVALLAPSGPYLVGRLPRAGTGGLHLRPPDTLQLSRNSALLLSASSDPADRHVKLWEVVSGRLLLEWSPGQEGRLLAALDPEGRSVAVLAGTTLTVHPVGDARFQTYRCVHDKDSAGFDLTDQGEIVRTCQLPPQVQPTGPSRDLDWYAPNGSAKRGGVIRNVVPFALERATMTVHPQGIGIAHLAVENEIAINKPSYGDERVSVARGPVDCLAVAPDGQCLWGNLGLTAVHSWRWGTSERVTSWEAGGRIRCLAAGQTTILAGDDKGRLHFLHPQSGQPAHAPLQLGTKVVTAAALFPNGKLALAGTDDGAVLLIDVPGRTVRQRLQEHTQSVTWLTVRADGERLASAGRDGLVHVYQVENDSANLLFTLPFDAPVAVLRYHPDRQQLVILLERERGLRFWNLERLEKELGRNETALGDRK